jgi:hypothetical protein
MMGLQKNSWVVFVISQDQPSVAAYCRTDLRGRDQRPQFPPPMPPPPSLFLFWGGVDWVRQKKMHPVWCSGMDGFA